MSFLLLKLCLAAAVGGTVATSLAQKAPPNIVFIYTDDQDVELGSLEAIPKIRANVFEGGATFEKFFVTTPICCASRSSLLTGRYQHNINGESNWCGNFSQAYQNKTFSLLLQEKGYATGMFGKFTNDLANYCGKNAHVPLGYDKWFHTCRLNIYYNNSFCEDGKMVQFGDSPNDYMTSLIGNRTIDFIAERKGQNKDQPLFLYIAPHAPHVPATPAPWYVDHEFKVDKAPRTPNWNASGKGKHWLLDQQPPLTNYLAKMSDRLFVDRWRSLLSVDDIFDAVYKKFEELGELDNTYFMYSSDHGYNLGQFRLPSGKFHAFENDLRVPFAISGPGIGPGTKVQRTIGLNLDISSTILDLAQVSREKKLGWQAKSDGMSLKPFLNIDGATSSHGSSDKPTPRHRFIAEYWGVNPTMWVRRGPCSGWVTSCPDNVNEERIEDCPSNTFTSLRVINETHNLYFTKFSNRQTDPYFKSPNFTEAYDMLEDPYQMSNIFGSMRKNERDALTAELYSLNSCVGDGCR